MSIIKIIIPAYNDERGIGEVIRKIPKIRIKEIVVVNNAFSGNTAKIAITEGNYSG